MGILNNPIQIGKLEIKNRLVMPGRYGVTADVGMWEKNGNVL